MGIAQMQPQVHQMKKKNGAGPVVPHMVAPLIYTLLTFKVLLWSLLQSQVYVFQWLMWVCCIEVAVCA
jgi:hypothetical protein